MQWDVFISHATEDKKDFVKGLVHKLNSTGAKVWYDEFSLKIGDSLSKSLDQGLSNSLFGLIIISPNFINKGWTDYELRSFINREVGYKKVILPIWHNITKEEVQKFSPFLADKFALNTATNSLDEITLKILEVVRPDIFENLQRHLQYEKIIREGEKRLSTPDDVFHSILFHPKLPVDITNRIELMHKILGKPSGIPLKKTIENFKRDMHPEKELKIWEAMAVAFLEIVETYKIEATDAKAEVFKLLLGYSMGIPPTETRFASDGALFKILAAFQKHYPRPEK
jgi:TIR domain